MVNTCRAWSPAPTCPQAPLVLTAQEFYSHSHQCCPLPLKMPDRNDVKGEHGVEGHDVEASYLCDLGFSCGVWNVQGFPMPARSRHCWWWRGPGKASGLTGARAGGTGQWAPQQRKEPRLLPGSLMPGSGLLWANDAQATFMIPPPPRLPGAEQDVGQKWILTKGAVL